MHGTINGLEEESTQMKFRDSKTYTLVITGLALFAMFFGAGNLIFPIMIGVDAGTNVSWALIGFLCTGVLLPVLGMIAVATSQDGITGIANRIGRVPGLVFTVTVFLSTGMLYAIPRVATVSYEMSVKPLLTSGGQPSDITSADAVGLAVYTLVFFAVVTLMVLNPTELLERIGAWLTPALVILLVVLISAAFFKLPSTAVAPAAKFADNPMPTGIIEGYFTMDALASFVFGIVIIVSLRNRGFKTKQQVFSGTAKAGVIAGTLLALVYIGLTLLGNRVAGQGLTNGAQALATAASSLFGHGGQVIFGLIALLACLTTAVGLVGASVQYFRTLFPRVGYKQMVAVHIAVSLLLANMGLEAILKVVAPLNQFIYPAAICVIVVCLVDIPVPGKLKWAYRLPAWVAFFISAFEALYSTELPAFEGLRYYMDMLPLGQVQMAWVMPALVALIAGMVLDAYQGRIKHEFEDVAESDGAILEGARGL